MRPSLVSELLDFLVLEEFRALYSRNEDFADKSQFERLTQEYLSRLKKLQKFESSLVVPTTLRGRGKGPRSMNRMKVAPFVEEASADPLPLSFSRDCAGDLSLHFEEANQESRE